MLVPAHSGRRCVRTFNPWAVNLLPARPMEYVLMTPLGYSIIHIFSFQGRSQNRAHFIQHIEIVAPSRQGTDATVSGDSR